MGRAAGDPAVLGQNRRAHSSGAGQILLVRASVLRATETAGPARSQVLVRRPRRLRAVPRRRLLSRPLRSGGFAGSVSRRAALGLAIWMLMSEPSTSGGSSTRSGRGGAVSLVLTATDTGGLAVSGLGGVAGANGARPTMALRRERETSICSSLTVATISAETAATMSRSLPSSRVASATMALAKMSLRSQGRGPVETSAVGVNASLQSICP